jgi:para-aminobenzoate synthetase component 1
MDPVQVFTSKSEEGMNTVDTLADLDHVLSRYTQIHDPELPPFQGGFAGYLSYDYGRRIEVLPVKATDDMELPDFWFGLYDVVLAIDHLADKTYLICQPKLSSAELCGKKLERVMGLVEEYFRKLTDLANGDALVKSQISNEPHLESVITKAAYCEKVGRVREYIYDGDVFQVNLSQRFIKQTTDSAWLLYTKLIHANGAPFSAYIDDSENQILCSSPERFIKVERSEQGRQIETRPIKGSRKRGGTVEEDENSINDLLGSEKDEAELKMIVDLCRNDFGKICTPGSIVVKSHRQIEKYSSVIHTVSIVVGRLERNTRVHDIINAVFPGGSITGAPKVRAMEIIEELEEYRRGIYCGSIGFIGLNGNIDMNIAIRTILHKAGTLYYNGGGGIVAASSPEKEYDETLFKVLAMTKAIS